MHCTSKKVFACDESKMHLVEKSLLIAAAFYVLLPFADFLWLE